MKTKTKITDKFCEEWQTVFIMEIIKYVSVLPLDALVDLWEVIQMPDKNIALKSTQWYDWAKELNRYIKPEDDLFKHIERLVWRCWLDVEKLPNYAWVVKIANINVVDYNRCPEDMKEHISFVVPSATMFMRAIRSYKNLSKATTELKR